MAEKTYFRHWECTECGFKCIWSYEDLAEMGTPQCPDCDDDMSLIAEGKE